MKVKGKSIATSNFREKKYFSLVVDDFFSNPKLIVDYLKSKPMEKDPESFWPGKRTESIHLFNEDISRAIILKILGCYYDLQYHDIFWNYADLTFQSIPPFSLDKNDIRNKGWIHRDGVQNIELSGLIYLKENIDPDSGTSIFKVKNENYVEQTHFAKTAFFKNPTDYDEKYHIEEYNKHLDNFIETTRFQNIFNRMIMYDPNEFHRANSYYVGSEDESRLTLVYFIGGIEAGSTPLNRIKYEEYDSFIDYRIKHESEEK